MAARRQRPDPSGREILDAIDAAIAEARRVRHGARRRHQQHARRRSSRWRAARSAAVVFYELIRFNAPDPDGVVDAGARASSTALRADRARARQPRGARAVLGVAGAVPRDSRGRRARRDRAVQRPPGGVGRGGRVPPRRQRRRGARCSRRSAPGIRRGQPPGVRPGRVPRSTAAFSTRACSPCTACR